MFFSNSRAIFKECLLNARFIEKSLKDWEGKSGSKIFEVFSNVSSEKPALPVIAFTSVKKNLQVEIEIFIQKVEFCGLIYLSEN